MIERLMGVHTGSSGLMLLLLLILVMLIMLLLLPVLSMGRVVDWWRWRRTVHTWRCLGMRIVQMMSWPSINRVSLPLPSPMLTIHAAAAVLLSQEFDSLQPLFPDLEIMDLKFTK